VEGDVMTTATETGFSVLPIADAAVAQGGEERQRVALRSELGIGSFGVNAVRAVAAGTTVIADHDEAGPGSDLHEELYLVLAGHAVFTVAGEEVDAPHGTALFVRDPELRRSAVAKEDGTIVVAVGARPGEPFRITPSEAMRDFFEPYNAKDYAGALEIARGILHKYPGNALALYNIACMEALLGKPDDALAHLREALEASPRLRENARTDDDFTSLRGDERFEALVT
jgi:tetratricopeptide (TPR) repeat protein